MTTERVGAHALAKKLAARGTSLHGENRLVTALFADISGFTALAEELDPEELLEVIDPVVEALSDVVARYGGYVEKFAGDALLAIFGAPVSHDDDPARALIVALEMQEELRRVRDDGRLTLHIGVNTGHGIARVIGNEARIDYGVLGEAIVIAQRLEAAAPPGAVYVGTETHVLTGAHFDFEAVGPLDLKGRAEPLEAWRLVARRRVPRAARTPLVGRAPEVARLGERLRLLRSGEGSVLAVLGEPGIGKSRLVRDARDRSETQELAWLETRCVSYGGGIPYWPFAELLRMLGMSEADDPHLRRLVGEPAPEVENLEPDEARRALHRVYTGRIRAQADERPTVLLLEDAHWADKPSLELAAELAALTATAPLMLVVTARDESRDELAALASHGTSHDTIDLQPLGDADTAGLLATMLGPSPPGALAEAVAARTGGNPFFVEEFVRALQQSNALRRADGGWQLEPGWDAELMPLTVEGVLSARIDLLTTSGAALAQTAAVIGRRIPLALLRMLESDLDPLDELVRWRLVDRIDGETVAFHHALVQDVAYRRLLRRRRRELHAQIADAAESLYGAGDDTIDFLARHLYLAEDPRSVEYLARAGDRAARLYANDAAIRHYERALERVGESDRERSADLGERIADLLHVVGRHNDARTAWREASARHPSPTRTARNEAKTAYSFQLQQRLDEASAALDRAEAALGAQPAEDDEEWWRTWIDVQDTRMSLLYWLDRPDDMARVIDRAQDALDRVATPNQRLRFMHSALMVRLRRERYTLSAETAALARSVYELGSELGEPLRAFNAGFALLWAGELDDAERMLVESLDEARRVGHMTTLVRSLTYLALLYRARNDPDGVSRCVAQARELESDVRSVGYGALLDANLAWLEWRTGAVSRAEEPARAALDTAGDRAGALRMFAWAGVWPLVAALLDRGAVEEAAQTVQRLLEEPAQTPPAGVAEAVRATAEACAANDGDAARALLERGLAAAEAAGRT